MLHLLSSKILQKQLLTKQKLRVIANLWVNVHKPRLILEQLYKVLFSFEDLKKKYVAKRKLSSNIHIYFIHTK